MRSKKGGKRLWFGGIFLAAGAVILLALLWKYGVLHKQNVTKTISFMAIANGDSALKNEHSDKVIQKYEDYTGIHVEWQWILGGSHKEQLHYILMNHSNMPMILTVGNNMKADIVESAYKGSFWDLAPFLEREDLFPNLSKADPRVLNAFKMDGKQIGIYRARPIGRYGLSYRKDWAEAVGITKEPQTVEDVYEMLYRFTYEDPDGNGIDDTYGLEMTRGVKSFEIIQTWFGCGNGWVEQDGKMIPVHETEEYMEALGWLRKIYDEGLMRPDWTLVSPEAFGDAVRNGEAGVVVETTNHSSGAWEYFRSNNISSASDNVGTAEMKLVGPIENATLSTEGYNGFFVITKDGARTEEDVINCLTFLDKMCDEEMLLLANYGLEGISYDLDEAGRIVKRTDIAAVERPEYGLNQALCYIPHSDVPPERLSQKDIQEEVNRLYERNEKVAVYNPAVGYLVNSETNIVKGSALNEMLLEARTAYVCGQITEEELKMKWNEWNQAGGEKLKKEINKMYQENS